MMGRYDKSSATSVMEIVFPHDDTADDEVANAVIPRSVRSPELNRNTQPSSKTMMTMIVVPRKNNLVVE